MKSLSTILSKMLGKAREDFYHNIRPQRTPALSNIKLGHHRRWEEWNLDWGNSDLDDLKRQLASAINDKSEVKLGSLRIITTEVPLPFHIAVDQSTSSSSGTNNSFSSKKAANFLLMPDPNSRPETLYFSIILLRVKTLPYGHLENTILVFITS